MKKSNLLICAFASATTLIAGPGCGLIKNMDEMHDATNKMANLTEQMNKQMQTTNNTTGHMSDRTDGMAGDVHSTACTAAETYEALRQGNTLQARAGEDALSGMRNATSIENKIFYAGAYMKAFEFQIPNCVDPNAEEHLHEFYQEAAEEFTRILPSYLTTDRSKWSVSATSTASHANDLYALAVSLQELNANMVVAWKLAKIPTKPLSMLDLIQSAFTRKQYLAAHPEEATLADHEFLANEDLLVQLFQVRMNFLAAMSLAKVSNLEQKGFLGLPGLIRGAKMLLGGWTPNLRLFGSQNDVERIKMFTRFLYGSNDIRAYMQSIGVQPLYDTTIYKMYAHMRTGGALQPKIPNPKTDADLAFNNTQDEIAKYLEQLDIFFGRKAFHKILQLDHPEFYQH